MEELNKRALKGCINKEHVLKLEKEFIEKISEMNKKPEETQGEKMENKILTIDTCVTDMVWENAFKKACAITDDVDRAHELADQEVSDFLDQYEENSAISKKCLDSWLAEDLNPYVSYKELY